MPRQRSDKPLDKRPAYEGMGLGLFIAKTLLERTGAELNFANGSNPFLSVADVNHGHGAIVEVTWPRSKIDAKFSGNRIPQGQNMPIKV
jgi:two-component system sensor histidine kinase RegB